MRIKQYYKLFCFLVLTSILVFFQHKAQAQFIRQSKQYDLSDLVCQYGKQKFRTRSVSGTSSLAYESDLDDRVILFFPTAALKLPEAISKLQFARSCLELLELLPEDELSQTCQMVRYLRDQNAFTRNDLMDVEDYYFSLTETDPNAYSIIKAVNQCY